MHVYVQKSTSTTFPRRPAGVSGPELSQPVAPSKPGRWPPIAPRRLLSRLTRPPRNRRLRGWRSSDLIGTRPGPRREQLRLLPGGEVTAPVDLDEVLRRRD